MKKLLFIPFMLFVANNTFAQKIAFYADSLAISNDVNTELFKKSEDGVFLNRITASSVDTVHFELSKDTLLYKDPSLNGLLARVNLNKYYLNSNGSADSIDYNISVTTSRNPQNIINRVKIVYDENGYIKKATDYDFDYLNKTYVKSRTLDYIVKDGNLIRILNGEIVIMEAEYYDSLRLGIDFTIVDRKFFSRMYFYENILGLRGRPNRCLIKKISSYENDGSLFFTNKYEYELNSVGSVVKCYFVWSSTLKSLMEVNYFSQPGILSVVDPFNSEESSENVTQTSFEGYKNLKGQGFLYSIIDLQGRVLSKGNIDSDNNPFAGLCGIYLLSISDSNGEIVHNGKFVK